MLAFRSVDLDDELRSNPLNIRSGINFLSFHEAIPRFFVGSGIRYCMARILEAFQE